MGCGCKRKKKKFKNKIDNVNGVIKHTVNIRGISDKKINISEFLSQKEIDELKTKGSNIIAKKINKSLKEKFN